MAPLFHDFQHAYNHFKNLMLEFPVQKCVAMETKTLCNSLYSKPETKTKQNNTNTYFLCTGH